MKTCSVKDCEGKHYAKTFCRKHHTRFLRNGTTDSLYDLSGYDPLDGVKDTRKGHRGNLAVNIINDIKYKATQRKKEWAITHRQAFDLIRSPCSYCGFVPNWPKSRVGIDRIDNSVGYTVENCNPCCFTCNSAKGVMGKEEFRAWLHRIYTHHCKS